MPASVEKHVASFKEVFSVATGCQPYPYQVRLAMSSGREDQAEDASNSTPAEPCQSQIIEIPTGMGKTAAVVLAWVWNRLFLEQSQWPRRLVYCLPMRTLVEQTAGEVERWLWNLLQAYPDNQELRWLCGIGSEEAIPDTKEPPTEKMRSPVILMGGEDLSQNKRGWDLHPERPCILIGTQDMLLSRALNRGYGMSRYRWPMHFALLNNDALWVLDEVQLMGVGIETSTQFQAFRKEFSTHSQSATWWMSATLDARQLETVDAAEWAPSLPRLGLNQKDRILESVRQRENALKPLQQAVARLEGTKKEDLAAYIQTLGSEVLASFQKASTETAKPLVLVILNRVGRAQDLYQVLGKHKDLASTQLLLIHSRFRELERTEQRARLHDLQEQGGIIIATQAIEAGVDLSARILYTELAPWSSLVQRFGRANRRGEFNETWGAQLFWMRLEGEDAALPYRVEELAQARKLLGNVGDASPANLETAGRDYQPDLPIRPVIRRKDLLELFDTTPDLTGSDIDVSRYIRVSDDTDVLVWWADFSEKYPSADLPEPPRDQLCRVPVGQFNRFLKNKVKPRTFRWNPTLLAKKGNWEAITTGRAIPGKTYLVHAATAGYSPQLGWTGNPKDALDLSPIKDASLDQHPDGNDSDAATFTGQWQSIGDHCEDVLREVEQLGAALELEPNLVETLREAARWHDAGKAHPVFQHMLGEVEDRPEDFDAQLWAKSKRPKGHRANYERRGFRHELASALLYRQRPELARTDDRPLATYLIATHHGKVRLGLRSLPREAKPKDEALFARGVWQGDSVPKEEAPPLRLPGLDAPVPPTALDLACIRLGTDSWAADALHLLRQHGPFLLAYLETLLRAADGRRS